MPRPINHAKPAAPTPAAPPGPSHEVRLLEWRPERTRLWEIAQQARSRPEPEHVLRYRRLPWPQKLAYCLDELWSQAEYPPNGAERRRAARRAGRLILRAAALRREMDATSLGELDPDLVRDMIDQARRSAETDL